MFSTPGGAGTDFTELAARLDGVNPAKLDVAGVEATVAGIADARRWLDALEVGCIERADTLAEAGLGAGASGTLVTAGRSTSRDAARARDRARTVADAPALGDALAIGDIDAAHIDAVARAAARLDDDARHTLLGDAATLVEEAARMPPDSFETRCRQRATEAEGAAGLAKRLEQQRKNSRVRKGVNPTTGMFWISGDWDPLTGERLHTCIDAQARVMAKQLGRPFGPHLDAHALAALVFRGAKRAGIDPGPDPAPHDEGPAGELSTDPPGVCHAADGTTAGSTAATDLAVDQVTAPGDEAVTIYADLATLTQASGTCETEHGTHLPTSTVDRLRIGSITALSRDRHGVILGGHRYRTQGPPEVEPSPTDQPGDPPLELLVLVDKPPGDDEPPPAPDAVARLVAHTLDIALGRSTAIVLQANRAIRIANRAQRQALRAMYPTCAIHGCTTPFHHCQIHHLHHWEQGGLTNLDNLLPLCCAHHHLIHDANWNLSLDHHRQLTTTRPDGTIHSISPLPGARDQRPRPSVPTGDGMQRERDGGAARPSMDPSGDDPTQRAYRARASRTSTASSARSRGTRR